MDVWICFGMSGHVLRCLDLLYVSSFCLRRLLLWGNQFSELNSDLLEQFFLSVGSPLQGNPFSESVRVRTVRSVCVVSPLWEFVFVSLTFVNCFCFCLRGLPFWGIHCQISNFLRAVLSVCGVSPSGEFMFRVLALLNICFCLWVSPLGEFIFRILICVNSSFWLGSHWDHFLCAH